MKFSAYLRRTGVLLCAAAGLFAGTGCCRNPVENLPLGVVGGIEPVTIEPFREPFPAKMDTGADVASIGVRDVREFVRDGKKMVAFTIVQRGTKAVEKYELPVARVMPITRHGRKPQKRFVVLLKIRLGHLDMVREFSLADRSNFSYQVLLGKNVIAGNAAIDVTRRNTLAREPGS